MIIESRWSNCEILAKFISSLSTSTVLIRENKQKKLRKIASGNDNQVDNQSGRKPKVH